MNIQEVKKNILEKINAKIEKASIKELHTLSSSLSTLSIIKEDNYEKDMFNKLFTLFDKMNDKESLKNKKGKKNVIQRVS